MFGLMIVSILSGQLLPAQEQRRDKGVMVEHKNEFMDSFRMEVKKFAEGTKEPEIDFQMDFSGLDLPASVEEFTRYWHNPPISQGETGTCWCFAATSYFESEIYRLSKREIKLSEMFTVYWEYLGKARRWVQERGTSEFGEGSEVNALIRIWKQYGIVPEKDYTGLKPGQKFHDHAIHIVGYLEKDGADWFLIKDSGSGSRNGKNPGYYFYHEDYVKLKIMNFMVHKSAVEEVLKKF